MQIAVDAIVAARESAPFLGRDQRRACGHSLHDGQSRWAYHPAWRPTPAELRCGSIAAAAALLAKAGLPPRIMIDCSHANSAKNHERQVQVGHEIGTQIAAGDRRILGLMIESHLVAGRQDQAPGRPLVYGQSITDACISWTQTEALLEDLAAAARRRRDRTGRGALGRLI